MKPLTRIDIALLLFLLIVVSAPSYATVIDPPFTDKSVEYLKYIYGESTNIIFHTAGPGAPDTILGVMSAILNIGCLLFSGIIIGYTALSGVMNTAHEGQVMGKAYNSMWVPLRTTLALALMLPMASGFSVMQLGVLWFAGKGIGLADSTWEAALNHMDTSGTLYPPTVHVDGENIALRLLGMNICQAAVNQAAGEVAVTRSIKGHVIDLPDGAKGHKTVISFSGKGSSFLGGYWDKITSYDLDELPANVCGTSTISVSESTIGSNSYLTPVKEGEIRRDAYKELSTALTVLEDEMHVLAYNLVTDESPSWSGNEIADAAAVFESSITDAITTATSALNKEANKNTGWKDTALKNGWIDAGTWYISIVRLNEQVQGFAKEITNVEFTEPNSDALSDSDSVVGLIKKANLILTERTVNSKYGAIKASEESGLEDSKPSYWPQVSEGIGAIINSSAKAEDPIIAMAQIGHGLIWTMEAAYIASRMLAVVTGATSEAVKEGSTPLELIPGLGGLLKTGSVFLAETAKLIAQDAVQIVTIGIILLFPVALSLAFYLPTLPYFMWAMGVAGWFVLLIEATIAAPIWAAAHSIPEGDGAINNHAKAGYMICLSLFMRPTLMLFGLFSSMILMVVMGRFVLLTFQPMMASVNAEHTSGIVTFIAFLMILTSLMIAIAHRAFGLIHEIPDKVLRYIGAMNENLGEAASEKQGRQVFSGGVSRVGYKMENAGLSAGRRGLGKGSDSKMTTESNKRNSELSTT
ncbi:MAG: DotA/TraY family protein [gamma proteobacterium symbiont of Bathyaustriella thionipta]|nr:DotA/TraY family protein [gamma proteobacterium symbiont of Bathyaustriella thionipta]